MKKNSFLMALGKYSACCLVFVFGLLVSGTFLPRIAVWPAWTLVLRYTLGIALLGLPLAYLSSRLRLNVLLRWVLFAQLAWLLAVAGMGVEAVFFNSAGLVNGLLLSVLHLFGLALPLVFFTGAVAFLFQPKPKSAVVPRMEVGAAALAVGQM